MRGALSSLPSQRSCMRPNSLRGVHLAIQKFERPFTLLATHRPHQPLNTSTLDARFKDMPNFVFTGQALASGEGMSPTKTNWETKFNGNLVPPVISKSDEAFLEKGLEFVAGCDGIPIAELNDLFEKVGFPRRDPDRLALALANTYHVIWVRTSKKTRLAKEGQIVGFARATSDGVLSATIWDVSVLPAFQRKGLGRALMERITHKLVADEIPTITLYAEPVVVALYEKLGFTKDPEGIRGLAFQRRKKDKAQKKR